MRTIPRTAYTLIELLGAMAASTMLLLALASSVAISTSLVEPTDEDGSLRRDRVILDRINQDLRFATSIDATAGDRLAVERPDLSGAFQSMTYRSRSDGLTHQVDGGDQIELDPATPSLGHYVDGFTAATASQPHHRPRIRDVWSAQTDGGYGSSINLYLPDGARPGDLLLLITAYRNAFFVIPGTSGWDIANLNGNTDIGLIVQWQFMNSATPNRHPLYFPPGADVAVALLAIEHADPTAPFGWTGSQVGTSWYGNSSTFPQPIENASTIGNNTLNLQIFASTGNPLLSPTIGVASLVDCVNLVASPGTAGECSLGIVSRTGPLPSLSSTPRVWHRESANWVTIAMEVEGASE